MALRGKRPTLQHIADALGVSKSTVAQVLSRQPGARIGDAVRERVRAQALSMGYRPNRIASSLRTGVTNMIGLITGSVRVLTTPGALQDVYTTILAEMADSDYVMVQLLEDPQAKVDSVLSRGLLDGLIYISGDSRTERIDALLDHGLPLVVVYRSVRHRADVPFVTMDYAQGTADAVHRLVSAGVRSLALVAFQSNCDTNRTMIESFLRTTAGLSTQGVTGRHFDIVGHSAGHPHVPATAVEVADAGPFDGYIIDGHGPAAAAFGILEARGHPPPLPARVVFLTNAALTAQCDAGWYYIHRNRAVGQVAYRLLMDRLLGNGLEPQSCYLPFQVVQQGETQEEAE